MIALGIDTSTPAGSVAVQREDRLLGEINLDTGVHHQERLLRSIDYLLDLAGLNISGVDLFAVALGPGTFTGLRVGIATVKGLAVARGAPVFGFSTLLALAHRYIARGLPVAPMIDAGRGEVYSALYGGGQGGLREISPEQGGPPEAFLASLPSGPILFCGNGAGVYRDLILRMRSGNDALVGDPCFLGATLGRLGASKLREGCPWSIGSLKPNYLRPPDAELGRKP
jgi:tRNA threonylcarbamoyladenosine biosynthesis protein TsaB